MLVFLHILVNGRHARVQSIGYVPTWIRHPDYTVLPVRDALRRHEAPAGVLQASYRRTVSVVGRRRGVLEPLP
jgi:hypothetical protein